MHFYAGLLIGPFLLVAAATGMLYAASFQIEKYVYADQLQVPVGETTVPLSRQVRAALDAHPDGRLTAVRPSAEPGVTTQVLLKDPSVPADRSLAVFVDPYTAEVKGALPSYGSSGALPFRAWVSELHKNLNLGETGRLYSELAASWLWVVALGGLLLWIGRRRSGRGGRARALLLPERGATGRRRTLSWHGVVGLWSVAGLLVLAVTGLTWSTYAGENIKEFRTASGGATPTLSTAVKTPGADSGDHSGHEGHDGHEGHGGQKGDGNHDGHGAAAGTPAGAPAGTGSGQSCHETGGGGHADAASGRTAQAAPTDIGVDRVFEIAHEQKLTGPVEIVAPRDGTAYVVKQTDKQWPVHLDSMAVHPATGAVVDELRFADYPLLAKLTRYGIDLHMGTTFGLVNQIVLFALGLGLVLLTLWGYRMWWLRRPTKDRALSVGRPMPRGAWRRVPLHLLLPLIAAVVVVGVWVPLLGISLLLFLAVDLAVGLVARLRGRGRNGNRDGDARTAS
ncbi:PepSY-associated TM helix domain-containing protein [Streptomyces sp. URMC 123]|uniref:PepSY-associated TM helix domain-containing protein n=1 Tax=Streptomyces sp. URMC 123 TaxID=3423403 RepID=UPI003F1C9BDE